MLYPLSYPVPSVRNPCLEPSWVRQHQHTLNARDFRLLITRCYCKWWVVLVDMPDPFRKRFGHGQLWPLRPACRQDRAGSYSMSDPISRIQFGRFFQRWPGSYCTKPARFRCGGSGLVMAKRILSGSKPVCQNHRARFLAGRNQPSTSFSLSDSAAFFHRRPGSYFAKPVRIRFGSDCVRFWPKGSGPEASRCEESSGPLWPTLLSRSGLGANWIRHY